MVDLQKRVGFVATGSELINGDILNTNGQYFCQELLKHNIIPGQQIVVGDNEVEIQEAIEYLKSKHQAIITIGGLGPTIDDRTRIGLAHVLQKPLEFQPNAWEWIVTKITSLGYHHVPENNRQQAYFPKGAILFKNDEGTAAACYLQEHEHDFFMLPGPPNEAHAIFDGPVIKTLLERGYATSIYRKSWLLLGVSEGEIAEKLQPLIQKSTAIDLGFRVCYPYLEVKLSAAEENLMTPLSQKFLALFSGHLVSEKQQTASEQLREWLLENKITLNLEDHATQGAMLQCLITPETYRSLCSTKPEITVVIEGLTPYWLNQTKTTSLPIAVTIIEQEQKTTLTIEAPLRGHRTIPSAVERISWQLLYFLKQRSA